MEYLNTNVTTEQILLSANTIAIPGGRENGNVVEWMSSMGFEIPDMAGRCLHFRNKKQNNIRVTR